MLSLIDLKNKKMFQKIQVKKYINIKKGGMGYYLLNVTKLVKDLLAKKKLDITIDEKSGKVTYNDLFHISIVDQKSPDDEPLILKNQKINKIGDKIRYIGNVTKFFTMEQELNIANPLDLKKDYIVTIYKKKDET